MSQSRTFVVLSRQLVDGRLKYADEDTAREAARANVREQGGGYYVVELLSLSVSEQVTKEESVSSDQAQATKK